MTITEKPSLRGKQAKLLASNIELQESRNVEKLELTRWPTKRRQLKLRLLSHRLLAQHVIDPVSLTIYSFSRYTPCDLPDYDEPNISELSSIVNTSAISPLVNIALMPSTKRRKAVPHHNTFSYDIDTDCALAVEIRTLIDRIQFDSRSRLIEKGYLEIFIKDQLGKLLDVLGLLFKHASTLRSVERHRINHLPYNSLASTSQMPSQSVSLVRPDDDEQTRQVLRNHTEQVIQPQPSNRETSQVVITWEHVLYAAQAIGLPDNVIEATYEKIAPKFDPGRNFLGLESSKFQSIIEEADNYMR
ncbi:4022_t:CDS:2 [Paraglomus occultum]|uniref:4022_t:CDS:1 n=1 Tax=Paraglomus occultum TaxID=144539 RepID=A0A9N9G1F5_9GLOM|nr:4022_t:CDS:2 [Paraglomus occultum]